MALDFPENVWNPIWMSPLDVKDIEELFLEKSNYEEIYSESINLWESNPNLDSLDRSLEYFVKYYLQDNILVKTDRASMLNSIETRSVFLDPGIADFSRKLPNKYKLNGNIQKFILKKTYQNKLPKKLCIERKKGFGIPLIEFYKKLDFEKLPLNKLSLNNELFIEKLCDHRSGKNDSRIFLWSWLVFISSKGLP